MTQIGLMIEGQEGLNWARWKNILQAAEDFGYQCVFRSDHYTNPSPPDMDSLELWVSLTYAASHTKRIEFGPLVTPVTFRHPTMTVRSAAAVDDLSGGRLVLGLGAGWNEREHTQFGVPFYDRNTRFEMFEDALEITERLLLSDGRVNYAGKHFSLEDAILLPRPKRPAGPPLLIGGNGPNRTLPLVAKYADEWNAVYTTVSQIKENNMRLDQLLREHGREPSDVKRSLMHRVVYGKAASSEHEGLRERDGFIGSVQEIVDQIGRFVEAGVERVMLQWLELDDIDGLEALARDVLPHFHKA